MRMEAKKVDIRIPSDSKLRGVTLVFTSGIFNIFRPYRFPLFTVSNLNVVQNASTAGKIILKYFTLLTLQ